jgi:membrane-bound ClpP family serine protease
MVAAPARCPRRLLLPAGALAVLALAVPAAPAQEPRGWQKDGLFITVPNPITDSAVSQIEARINDARSRQKRTLQTIVFDFNPGGQPAGTSKFPSCLGLKDLIWKLRTKDSLSTVAFLHNEVTKHTVLPVLACDEIVMSRGAKLGQVQRDAEDRLTEAARSEYAAVAARKGSPDLVWKMIYADLALARVKTKDGVRYVDRKTLPEGARVEVPPGLDVGVANTLFDTARARGVELCKAVYESRADVQRAYGLSPRSLREDTLPPDKMAVVARVDLTGTVNKAKLDSLERRVKNAVGRGANVIVVYLDCEGGETVDVASTANVLGTLRDAPEKPIVKTIAYVPPHRSLGAATFLALGCSEIVMAKDAVLGDFEYLRSAGEHLEMTRKMLVELADRQGYPPLLFQATLEPGMVLYRAHPPQKTTPLRIMSEQDLKASGGAWVPAGRIPIPEGQLLKIDASLAKDWGVANYTDVESIDDLYARYNLDPSRVRVSRDDWLDKVAEFFREEIVKIILIMVGIAGLILELKMPGVGIPGVIAAICFVLFFWAHSFVGQFTMLAVLLFVLGLILIGLEIFVVPGFGVTVISGVVLVVVSLVLVTLERMPQTTEDWLSVGGTVTSLGVGLVAAIAGAFVLAWYLPHIPYVSRLVLAPPEHEDGIDPDAFGGRQESAAALLGAIGVAATTLRPAGKARFGDDYLDVIAEGDYVNPGSRVQVIEIEGNRIVVKEV